MTTEVAGALNFLFKDNFGKWTFREQPDGTTKVEYEINVKFNLFVPGMIEKKLIEVNLPSMMRAFKEQAEGVA
jgi:ribosome-associated toxin RatA of RatAB toxin-antitoxin module